MLHDANGHSSIGSWSEYSGFELSCKIVGRGMDFRSASFTGGMAGSGGGAFGTSMAVVCLSIDSGNELS